MICRVWAATHLHCRTFTESLRGQQSADLLNRFPAFLSLGSLCWPPLNLGQKTFMPYRKVPYKFLATKVIAATLQRPANLAEILMGCEVSVNRGGVRHKYLNGTGGASRSKERRASDPSPKQKGPWPRTSERFALLLQLPVLAAPPYRKFVGRVCTYLWWS